MKQGRFGQLMGIAGTALVVGAVVKELRKPRDQRTWTGRIVGLPYDFRPPTPTRIRRAFWDPDNPALLTPHVFGVGYSVNLARIAAAVRSAKVAPTKSDQPAGT